MTTQPLALLLPTVFAMIACSPASTQNTDEEEFEIEGTPRADGSRYACWAAISTQPAIVRTAQRRSPD